MGTALRSPGSWSTKLRTVLLITSVVGLLTASGLFVSACSRSSPRSSAMIHLARAVSLTQSAGTALTTVSLHMLSARVGPVSGKATGVVDFADHDGRMELYGFGLPERSGTAVVFTNSAIYMKLPQYARLKGQGSKPWLGLLLSDLNAVSTAQAGFVFQAETVNAVYLLDAISRGAVAFNKAPARGNSAPYQGTVNLATAQRYSSGLDAMVLSQQETFTGVETAPLYVWLDSRGRIAKFQMILDPSQSSGGSHLSGKVTITVSLREFGVPSQVVAPPTGEVANLDVILENLSGGEMGEPPGETPGQ
ncbi:MAG: hypothetical protein M0008_07005 [Actinomycetota bacterium]|nr:hypothetical protein [Actinomycetota bacterium]